MSAKVFKALEAKTRLKNYKPSQEYEIIDTLGQGSYGAVFLARHKKKQSLHAIKQIPIDENLEDLLREIEYMMDCKSKHVVRFDDCYLSEEGVLCIVMEYCAAGSVADILRLNQTSLTERQILHVVRDVLTGLNMLHSKNRIHRDIKAENVLVTEDGTSKLGDFGVSGTLSKDAAARHTVIGTPFWMAPEVIQEIGYNCKADIWSLAITIIEMAEGHPPLSNIHPLRAIFIIPAQPPPVLQSKSKWSANMHDFLEKCLKKDQDERFSTLQCLEHPWLKQYTSNSNPLIDIIARTNSLIKQYGGREKAFSAIYVNDESSNSNSLSKNTSDSSLKDIPGVNTMIVKEENDTLAQSMSFLNFDTYQKLPLPSMKKPRPTSCSDTQSFSECPDSSEINAEERKSEPDSLELETTQHDTAGSNSIEQKLEKTTGQKEDSCGGKKKKKKIFHIWKKIWRRDT